MQERTDLQVKLGKTIQMLRKERGMTQDDFCRTNNFDKRYLSNIENGQRNVSVDIIDRLATAFGMKASELFLVVENQK